ncbi:hypothetical protein M0Q97_10320 [Candidatus Dojkabacteria bacterium]|jgi:hypothetical protein|nr:hypothetical protein [Candidatus Dojkabacteria bacterium]
MKYLKNYIEFEYNTHVIPDPQSINFNLDYVGTDYYQIDPEKDETEPPNTTGRDDRETKNKLKKAIYKISVT